MQRRSHRQEKLARIYDDEILELWSQRFARMLLRDLTIPESSQLLNVTCATGQVALELSRLMGDSGRLTAIDERSSMLDVARRKLRKTDTNAVFLRSEQLEPTLPFGNNVYDLVVGNLTLAEANNPSAVVADLARVTKPGGELRLTLPLAGSFGEFFDLYREVLMKYDNHAAQDRLNDYESTAFATEDTVETWATECGLTSIHLDIDEFELLFRSSREFFYAPVIEYGPLADWKAIAGSGHEMQDVFWYIKKAIDSYYADSAFAVTIRAGCLRAIKPSTAKEN